MPGQLYANNIASRNRPAVMLGNDTTRVVTCVDGGMTSELSYKGLNAHWKPHFRDMTGKEYDPEVNAKFYQCQLLYLAAGNWLCAPNFGGGCTAEGAEHPVHGVTSNSRWRLDSLSSLDNAAYAKMTLSDPKSGFDFTRYDIVVAGHPVHYMVTKFKNTTDAPKHMNAAWHNTVDAPFLQPGCLIDLCADRYATMPTEFEPTQRLVIGAEFDRLTNAPGIDGKRINVRKVPGRIGATDFVTGAIPRDIDLGWGSILNPMQRLVYISFFKGPDRAIADGEVPLFFNDLWLQFGGRPSTPWANEDKGTDITYCLGQENGTGAFANGLAASLDMPTVLGNPTTVEVPAGKEMALYYGTLLAPLGNLDTKSVRLIGRDGQKLIVGHKGDFGIGIHETKLRADGSFESIAAIVDAIDHR